MRRATPPDLEPPAPVLAAARASGAAFRVVVRPPGVFRCRDIAAGSGLALCDVLKTLVVRLTDGRFALAVVPGDRSLSLPRLAQTLSARGAVLATPEEALAATGYPVGGITPLGPDRLPVVADGSVAGLGTVNVGGGLPEIGIEIAAPALLAQVRAVLADIGDPHPATAADQGSEDASCRWNEPTTSTSASQLCSDRSATPSPSDTPSAGSWPGPTNV